jgi:RNA polymerase sigma-70 factor (ECF subfamily)
MMIDETETDERLMLRLASGSAEALHILMTRHMRRGVRLAEGVTRSEADADDIAQEAFVRVWRNATAFNPSRARFSTWFHRIIINLSIDRARRPASEPLDEHLEIPTGEASALSVLLAKEDTRAKTQAIDRAIASLSERQRAAIALFHFEGLSGRDCAEAMGLSGKAFESLLHRARGALKKTLGQNSASGDET